MANRCQPVADLLASRGSRCTVEQSSGERTVSAHLALNAQVGIRHPVDPRACVDWAIRLTSNQLLHQARLLTSLREGPHVKANELKLSQVVVNLLTNAVQALST